MSRFFKALEQAERDHALGDRAAVPRPEPQPVSVVDQSATATVTPAMAVASAGDPDTAAIDGHLVSLLVPASFEAEQYRTLGHVVEQAHRSRQVSVVAVSAPGASDGKTTTAINLAGALAQTAGARVLLVDADLRHPAVAERLGLDPHGHPGLIQALRDPALGIRDVTVACTGFNLSVTTAGGAMASPHELLRAERLDALLAGARQDYDYVVLDTPPLVPVVDCRILAKVTDAFLVVVTAHQTPRALLAEALGVLASATVLGVVFNADEHWLDGAYYRSYRRRNGTRPRRSNGTGLDDVVGHGRRRRRRLRHGAVE